MAGNTTTKKKYNDVASSAVDVTRPSKSASTGGNMAGKNDGQLKGPGVEKYADPMQPVNAKIRGMDGLYDDIGEKSGFITDGYLDKQDTPYGEAAKFNFLPPGMDISNQQNAEIHEMPLRKLTSESYPGDGWMPTPRDVEE